MKKFTIHSLDNSFAFKAFTSADIIFQIFKTSFSIIRKKKTFVTNFPLLTDALKPPTLLKAKIC